MDKKILNKIASLINGTKFQNKVFLVGGSVRDYIMGNDSKDYDFCVELMNGGVELALYLTTTYPNICKNYVLFETYGTAKFTLEYDDVCEQIEVVETRKERYTDSSSRNPECVYGDLVSDCFRRDLTINSLYMNINDMSIIDLTGKGLDDIKNKIIRTPCDPHLTYRDDPLRLMRTIRFASRYNWEIEQETLFAMRKNAPRLLVVSKERIADELIKILTCEHPRKALELMEETKLMEYIICEFDNAYKMKQNEYHTGTVWEHTIDVVEKTHPTAIARMSALLHDIGKVNTKSYDEDGSVHFYKHEMESAIMAKSILKDLKFPNEFIDSVVTIVGNHMRLKPCGDDAKITDKALRKLKCDISDVFEDFLSVVNADNLSHSNNHILPNQIDNIRKRILKLSSEGSDISKIKLPISGFDVMRELKISPSIVVKDILNYVTEFYLDNPNISYDECIKLINTYKL